MVWFVYMIETESGCLYTGITTDIERRFSEHCSNKKGAKYFRMHPAKKIVFSEKYLDKSSASKREFSIRKLSREQKMALLAAPD